MIDLDPEIVRRAQAGDEEASRSLIEQLHRPVIATCFRFLGPRLRSEVEDVAQEVFVKVFRAIHRFDPDRGVKFTTWGLQLHPQPLLRHAQEAAVADDLTQPQRRR